MKVITTRVEEKDAKALEEIERAEKADRAEVVRRLLAKGIRDWKLEKALNQLREHKISIRTAARLADLTYSEMLDLCAREGITIGYTLAELERDVKRL